MSYIQTKTGKTSQLPLAIDELLQYTLKSGGGTKKNDCLCSPYVWPDETNKTFWLLVMMNGAE